MEPERRESIKHQFTEEERGMWNNIDKSLQIITEHFYSTFFFYF